MVVIDAIEKTVSERKRLQCEIILLLYQKDKTILKTPKISEIKQVPFQSLTRVFMKTQIVSSSKNKILVKKELFLAKQSVTIILKSQSLKILYQQQMSMVDQYTIRLNRQDKEYKEKRKNNDVKAAKPIQYIFREAVAFQQLNLQQNVEVIIDVCERLSYLF
ncbi:hypothetical protein ABPG72_020613 [Tetrahymena utriculariae]